MAYRAETHISSKHCALCHGDGEGYKCPECGINSQQYDPSHLKLCKNGGMMRVKCKKCEKAEINCTCPQSE
jgi:hypothetical protein